MDDNSKILNPICIRLDNYFDILLKTTEGYNSCSLMPLVLWLEGNIMVLL